jgi:uncharacterized membrane protein
MATTTMQHFTALTEKPQATHACPYVNISEAERWASLLGGGLIAGYGLSRVSLSGLALAALGGCLMCRGATGHCDVYGALNISTSGRGPATSVQAGEGMRVEVSTTIHRSPGDLYLYWRNLENLPRFMPFLRSVKVDGNRSHWAAAAPLGASVTWEAEIINEKEGEMIAWRSLPHSLVETAGSVHFRRAGDGTEVHVEMRYNPPAGRAGAALAWLFGEDGERMVRESLEVFKKQMERNDASISGGRPR